MYTWQRGEEYLEAGPHLDRTSALYRSSHLIEGRPPLTRMVAISECRNVYMFVDKSIRLQLQEFNVSSPDGYESASFLSDQIRRET
jgi:hypothetical protein